jgi:hypothetical protein
MKRTIVSIGWLLLTLQVLGCGGNVPDAPLITRENENTANLQTQSDSSSLQASNPQESTSQPRQAALPSPVSISPDPPPQTVNQDRKPAQIKKYFKPKRRF